MAAITKRGKRWYVQVRRKGQPSHSQTFVSHADAKAWAAIMEARIEQGEAPPQLGRLQSVTLSDLMDRYKAEVTPTKRSAFSERYRLEQMKGDPIASVDLASPKADHIADYRDRRLVQVSSGTARRELAIISHILEVAMREFAHRAIVADWANIHSPSIVNPEHPFLEGAYIGRLGTKDPSYAFFRLLGRGA